MYTPCVCPLLLQCVCLFVLSVGSFIIFIHRSVCVQILRLYSINHFSVCISLLIFNVKYIIYPMSASAGRHWELLWVSTAYAADTCLFLSVDCSQWSRRVRGTPVYTVGSQCLHGTTSSGVYVRRYPEMYTRIVRTLSATHTQLIAVSRLVVPSLLSTYIIWV